MNLRCFLFLFSIAFLPNCNKGPDPLEELPYDIFPKPCSGAVFIDGNLSPGEVMSVKLLGIQGDKIAETELTSTSPLAVFNVSAEKEGQLYFEIEFQGKLYREKVIKIN